MAEHNDDPEQGRLRGGFSRSAATEDDPQELDRESAELAEEQRLADMKWLMADPRGRRICWRLLDAAGIYRSMFHTEPHVMAFNEGHRNMGLRLLSELKEHPDHYLRMIQEAQSNG